MPHRHYDPSVFSKRPKKPGPPRIIFYEENMCKYHERHPELTREKLFKLIIDDYNALTEEEKVGSSLECSLSRMEHHMISSPSLTGPVRGKVPACACTIQEKVQVLNSTWECVLAPLFKKKKKKFL